MKLNFNERERKTHAAALRDIAKIASQAAQDLEGGEADAQFMAGVVTLSFMGMKVREILEDVMGAVEKIEPDSSRASADVFPDFIGDRSYNL